MIMIRGMMLHNNHHGDHQWREYRDDDDDDEYQGMQPQRLPVSVFRKSSFSLHETEMTHDGLDDVTTSDDTYDDEMVSSHNCFPEYEMRDIMMMRWYPVEMN